MRSTPELDAKLEARLREAVALYDGNTDALGRALGYTNGGYVRESLRADDVDAIGKKRKKKPVREALISRFDKSEDRRLHRFFDDLLTGFSAADAMTSATPLSAQAIRIAQAYDQAPKEQRRVFEALAESFGPPQENRTGTDG